MATFNVKRPPEPSPLRLGPFKGLNLSARMDMQQADDMLNFYLNEQGDLIKRTGFERVFLTSLGAGPITGLYEYRKLNGTVLFLLAHGTKLYTQSGSAQPVEIYNGLANRRLNFFTYNDKCYIMDGTNYLVYDGTTVSAVSPYIPTLSISRTPTGGGTKNEDLNLLGAGFKDSFSADGTATVYTLSQKGLDATTVTAVVNGTNITEGSGFTVDRSTGKVTFTTAPATGTNNVIITAYKTQSGWADRIKKCRFYTIFGGANDTRVFVSGNPDMPGYVWRLGLDDPTYAPETGFYKFPSKVMGFSKQYDYLVVERENGKHQVTYELSNGVASFPSKPINDQVGTLATRSLQIIENNPVSLSKTGVYMLMASNVRDERNVEHISENVDPRLLKEANLQNAISIDFDRKYWLAVNGNVYILDYNQKSQSSPFGEWYFFDNVKANCFLEKDGYLYFGSSTDGLIYRFKKETDVQPYNDDGTAIKAFWKSKKLSFGADELKKLVEKVFFSMKPGARTSADLYYVTNKKESDLVKSSRMDTFDFRDLDFGNLSFVLSFFPQEIMTKIKAKKITHFQLVIQNDKVDESLGILSLAIKYRYQSEVK